MDLSVFSELLNPLYIDKLTVRRHKEVTNRDGTTGIMTGKRPVIINVKCRISFYSPDTAESMKDDNNPVYLPIKIFCAVGEDIQKGDNITAERYKGNTIIETYTGTANKPFLYPTHQEVYLVQTGTA